MRKSLLLGMIALVIGFFAVGMAYAEEAIPNLVGTWGVKIEETHRHSKVTGYTPIYDQVLFIVKGQTGRAFFGVKEKYIGKKLVENEGFSGAIYWDNKTIYMADHEKGLTFATLESSTEIRGAYVEEGSTAKVALFALKKIS